MADLITHACTALLWKSATNGPRVAVFVAGTCLPDYLSRVPSMGFTVARWYVPWMSEAWVYMWGPLHMPAGILIYSWMFGYLFPADRRREAVVNLAGGGLLHMAVDVLQTHYGVGYLLLFPFSTWDWEAGLIGSEDTVRIVPFLLPLTGLAAWARWRRRPSKPPS